MEPVRWSFHTPTRLEFGEGLSLTVGEEIKSLGCARPLIVTDEGVVQAGIVGRIQNIIEEAGLQTRVFDGVESNPSVHTVHKGVQRQNEAGCDCVVAVGGGSSLDAGKAVAMLAVHGGAIDDYEIGKTPITKRGLPVIAMPTTAGTGSEMTYWSVITNPETHRKFDVGSPLMAPVVALDDPELTYKLPKGLTASTGMDALTHAIEAFITNESWPQTDILALGAIRIIGEHIRTAAHRATDREARRMMMLASAMAGCAFPNAGLGAVHGLTAPVGGHLNVAHGQANAALLPYVMEYNLKARLDKYAVIASALGVDTRHMKVEEAARAAIAAIRQMARDVGIPSLRKLGVREHMVPTLARESMGEFSNNNSNPVPLTVEDAENILMSAIAE